MTRRKYKTQNKFEIVNINWFCVVNTESNVWSIMKLANKDIETDTINALNRLKDLKGKKEEK